MRMTPRERVMSAVRHEVPDQIPAYLRNIYEWEKHAAHFGVATLEELRDRLGNCIVSIIPDSERLQVQPRGPAGAAAGLWGPAPEELKTYTDTYERPLAAAETAADVDAFAWPTADDWDFSAMRRCLESDTLHARIGPSWTPVLCALFDLFGMERALLNLHLNPVVIEAALEHIDAYYTGFFQRELDTCADQLEFFGLGDDFADNRGLLIRPDHWRRYFKPLWRKWLGMGKERGLVTFMHACGAISELLPDLIDMGLDVWQTVQTHLPGNEAARIKRDFGRHIAFVGGINTSHILWRGSATAVREHVRQIIQALGSGGGYVCAPDHTVMAEVCPENVEALYDACNSFRADGYTL